MKLNRFVMAASAVLCSFALLSGCSDDDVCKVYIPEAKTLQIKNFDLGEELREVFHVAVTASDYVTRSGKEVGGDVKVQLTVDEAKVQEYNSLCGTDYPLLPSDCYTLTTETVIPAGESSSADLVLTVNAQGKIQPFDSYLLPVTITSVEGAQADHIQQTVYYLLKRKKKIPQMRRFRKLRNRLLKKRIRKIKILTWMDLYQETLLLRTKRRQSMS